MKFSLPFVNCFCSIAQNNSQVDDDGDGYGRDLRRPGGQRVEHFPVYSYDALKAATQGFRSSNRIGEGGFGSVYKGMLQDGSLVAVKILSVELESMRGEREFISEIAALSGIKHENLVSLRGCCVDGAKRLLVYNYMENNSLAYTFLGEEHNRMKFSWKLRRDISIGVARGLVYLHEQVTPHIVHRDIKPSNILLDLHFTPKLGDFGLAKLFRDDASYISTRVAGTLGYLSPEYAISGHLTRKSDVYSFGVLLLEILTGGPVVGFDLERGGEYFLVDKVWEMYKANNLRQMVDPVLNGNFPEEEAVRLFKVGLMCVQETTKLRPKMSAAVKMLTNEIGIGDTEISKPGLLADLMDVKIDRKRQSSQSFFSGDSANASSAT
ncbi:putative serine/threonine-protein kinase isoform X1 [Coffea arabica]|uniref:Serine/threonine-protein kinase isoform X1 n=2 Tax=Coffea arabica TaxID=13443 RepID=A0A6P6SZN2_COFAR